MKHIFLTLFIPYIICSHAECQNVSSKDRVDSFNAKSERLKTLYILATGPTDISEAYQQQFFNEFPGTFKEINDLYNSYYGEQPLFLTQSAYKYIMFFNNMKNINDTTYYKKIVQISLGGHWDADAINYFQDGLIEKVLNDPALIVYIFKDLTDDKIKSFWHFYFDGPVVGKQIAKPLQKIKAINNRIYDLMIKAHNQALKQDQ